MTTVGYGNTAPTTEGGRAMIFTLGFFSVLLFAGILANAGSVVTAIIDDGIDRANLSYFNRPWASALFWGAMYYVWMVLIASYYQFWQEDRLEETIDYSDSYWFACKCALWGNKEYLTVSRGNDAVSIFFSFHLL